MAIVTRRYLFEGPSVDDIRNQTDPALTIASAELKLAFDVTWDDAIADVAAVDQAMLDAGGYVPDPGADTSLPPSFPGGGGSNALIYRPGSGLPGPIVFDVWADLIAELTSLRSSANGGGSYTILVDDSITSPAAIPVGTYDMTDVILAGRPNLPTKVTVPEGVIFQNLRRLTSFLEIECTGATSPVSDFAGSGSTQDVFIMSLAAKVQCTGTGAFFQNNSSAGQASIALDRGAEILPGPTQVIDAAVPGALVIISALAGRGVLGSNTVKAVAGSTVLLTVLESAAQLSEDQPAVAGSISPFNLTMARWAPSFVFTSSPGGPVDPHQVIQVDSTTGPF